MILRVDHEGRTVQLSTRAEELLKELQEPESKGAPNLPSLWRPEYGSFMVEGTPGRVIFYSSQHASVKIIPPLLERFLTNVLAF